MNIPTRYFLITVTLILASFNLIGQGIPSGGGSGGNERDDGFKFMPIPYIDYNRSLGFTVGAIPIAMYNLNKKDTVSPSSMSGALGMYTTTQSWFVVQFNKFYFNEDQYRATLVGGKGNINFQFFLDLPVSPGYIDYNTVATFFMAELQRKVYKKLYLGVNYSYTKLITNFDVANAPQQEDYLNGLGGVASLDLRDNVYYPHKGFIANLNYSTFPDFLDNEFVSQKIEIDYDYFVEMKNKKDIIGTRVYGGFGIGDLNFNQQFVVGQTDIRGYSLGKYRGEQIIAVQGEYRYNPFDKLGFVGFLGFASIFGSINDGDNGLILPGIGTGFRYMVFEKNHLNVGMDIAVGKGDWGLYFKVGESF